MKKEESVFFFLQKDLFLIKTNAIGILNESLQFCNKFVMCVLQEN